MGKSGKESKPLLLSGSFFSIPWLNVLAGEESANFPYTALEQLRLQPTGTSTCNMKHLNLQGY